ncbi:MAG TPA: MotA/TolQ/ExbB proton channel family protein [Lacipirellula sp.]
MSHTRKSTLLAALDASFLLGAVSTVIFYIIIHSPAMHGSLLHRYTTEHLVEYVVVALSFWGLADVLGKLFSYPREVFALRRQFLPELSHQREPVDNAAAHLDSINGLPKWLQDSRLGRRLAAALEHVALNGCDDHYREHLKSLSHKDHDRTHSDFTLIRFVVRITPVLGFLGTVVHFGTALNGISLDQMSEQLGVVVGEMGKAFNATTLALAAAMCMMFAQFVCEWIERVIVQAVDRTSEAELLNRFETKDADLTPFLRTVKDANEKSLQLIAANLDRQTAVWTAAIDGILTRFDGRQQQEAEVWTQALDVLNTRHETYDAVREERLRQLVDLIDQRQEKFMAHIQKTLEKAVAIRDDFGGMIETLNGIARGEGRLTELQSTLAENLRVIHETRQIEDALHGLTGAIHLLTARHGGDGRKAA